MNKILANLFLTAAFIATAVGGAAAGSIKFRVVDARQQPVAEAVISLIPLDTRATTQPAAVPAEIMQKGQEFSPYVTAITLGSSVVFPNRDTVQHHVYSLSKPKKFELPLYAGEAKPAVVFDQPGVVAVGCNIHDWMSAYIIVLTTPWFAKTDAAGAAGLSNVPAGRYRAEVWHPRLSKGETREIAVADAAIEPAAFTLTLKPDRRIKRTGGTGSGGYK